MDDKDNLHNLRVASFSCYLNTSEENLVLKLAGSLQDPPPAIISPHENPCPLNLRRFKTDEGEIGIFGSSKYFSTKMDYGRTMYSHKKEGHEDLRRTSVSSERSQSALLQNFQTDPSKTKQKRSFGRRFFGSFGCKPCLEKKVVHIKEPVLKTGEQFAFPVLDSGMHNQTVDKQLEEEKVEEEPRKSLEVFGSDIKKKGDIAANLERKLSILTWDAIPKAAPDLLTATFGSNTATFGSNTTCDDIASDASSDLFEIENISGTGYSLLNRQASDNMSACTSPTSQYAPSEASIEWSVVTASAADFSSIVSDYDEKNMNMAGDIRATGRAAKANCGVGKDGQKFRPSKLLGCGNHKAVRVAESAYRVSENEELQGSDLSMSFAKSYAEMGKKAIESFKHSYASSGLSP